MWNNSSCWVEEDETLLLSSHIFQYLILIFSVTGNFLFILSLIARRGGMNFVDKLMCNSVICNLILVSVSIPTNLATTHSSATSDVCFPFGPIGCKFIHPLSTCAINSCVFTYIAIAFERWMVVSSIHYSPPSRKQVIIVFSIIHSCGFVSVIPYINTLKLERVKGLLDCRETWDMMSRKSYTLALFLIQYGIPVPLMMIFYIKTWLVIYQSNMQVITNLVQRKETVELKCVVRIHGSLSDTESENGTIDVNLSPVSSIEDTRCEETPTTSDEENNIVAACLISRKRSNSTVHMRKEPTLLITTTNESQIKFYRREALRRGRSKSVFRAENNQQSQQLFSSTHQLQIPSKNAKISFSKKYFSLTGGVNMKKQRSQSVALKRRYKQTRQLLIRFTIIMLVFTICMLPNQVLWHLVDFYYNGNEAFSSLTHDIAYLITYTNCIINPLIYGQYNKKFRANVSRTFITIRKRLRGFLPNFCIPYYK